jgi:hypothetical protein
VALEERRNMMKSGADVFGALCVDCFDKAKTNLLPNQTCKICIGWGGLLFPVDTSKDAQESKPSLDVGLSKTNPPTLGG